MFSQSQTWYFGASNCVLVGFGQGIQYNSEKKTTCHWQVCWAAPSLEIGSMHALLLAVVLARPVETRSSQDCPKGAAAVKCLFTFVSFIQLDIVVRSFKKRFCWRETHLPGCWWDWTKMSKMSQSCNELNINMFVPMLIFTSTVRLKRCHELVF